MLFLVNLRVCPRLLLLLLTTRASLWGSLWLWPGEGGGTPRGGVGGDYAKLSFLEPLAPGGGELDEPAPPGPLHCIVELLLS